MLARVLHILTRIRLRLGLFRWRNYGRIYQCCPDSLHSSIWTVYWGDKIYGEGSFGSRREAIHHIRRCVKQGDRP